MRAAIFIDGAYFERIMKDEFGGPEVDFAKMSDVMARRREILRTYYYHCLPYQSSPPTAEERERFSNKQKFFTYLERLPRYCVRLGRLAFRGKDAGGIKRFEQKGVDTLICVDMVNLTASRQISDIIILTGDSDCIPGIKVVKQYGVVASLYHSAKKDSYHAELWQECDERFPIDTDFIEKIKRQKD